LVDFPAILLHDSICSTIALSYC